MIAPSRRWRWSAVRWASWCLAVVMIFCSLPGSVLKGEVDAGELKIAVDALRKENAGLKKLCALRGRELATATNQLALAASRLDDPRGDLGADDEGARSSEEWRAFLLSALKILRDADDEIQALQKRMQLLVTASEQALKTAQKVDPSRRGLLEAELRQSRKLLEGKDDGQGAVFATAAVAETLSAARVIGVRMDLGVAALAVGRTQGARVGMPFVVVRDGKPVATLVLVETRENRSLALIDRMDAGKPIRKGDTASLRKS